MDKYDIVCLSTQLWEDPMWTNKQHVMSRLAQRGHSILYVDPLIRVRMLANNVVFKHRYNPRRLLTFQKSLDNIHLLSPVRFLFSQDLERRFNVFLINRLLRQLKFKNVILWVYDPEFADYVKEISHSLLIYDCVDDYSAMPPERYSEKKRTEIIRKDEELTRKADIVFATSHHLYESRRQLNPKTYYTPNVADFEHNSRALDPSLPVAEDVSRLPQPIVGFQGNLSAFKFDFGLLEKVLVARPNWSFVFLGPVETSKTLTDTSRFASVDKLKTYPNAHFLGIKPYSELPRYYKAFSVGILPNAINEYNRSSFPLKFFEYLGAGLPVVMTPLPALSEFTSTPGVYVASSPEEFVSSLDQAIEAGKEFGQEERLNLAKQYSWEGKVDKMILIIGENLGDEGN